MSLIKKIRVANSSRTVDVDIVPCRFGDFVQWHRKIHKPFIEPAGGIGSDWYWPGFFVGCTVSEEALGRRCVTFQLQVADPLGEAVPIAQVILSFPYPSPSDERENCVFVWFVASTPKSALKNFKISETFSVLAAVLDTAVQVSLGHKLGGRIALHAAPGATEQESERLAEKYRKYGLTQRPKSKIFFRFPNRRDDGRLFYFTSAAAQKFAKEQDDLR